MRCAAAAERFLCHGASRESLECLLQFPRSLAQVARSGMDSRPTATGHCLEHSVKFEVVPVQKPPSPFTMQAPPRHASHVMPGCHVCRRWSWLQGFGRDGPCVPSPRDLPLGRDPHGESPRALWARRTDLHAWGCSRDVRGGTSGRISVPVAPGIDPGAHRVVRQGVAHHPRARRHGDARSLGPAPAPQSRVGPQRLSGVARRSPSRARPGELGPLRAGLSVCFSRSPLAGRQPYAGPSQAPWYGPHVPRHGRAVVSPCHDGSRFRAPCVFGRTPAHPGSHSGQPRGWRDGCGPDAPAHMEGGAGTGVQTRMAHDGIVRVCQGPRQRVFRRR